MGKKSTSSSNDFKNLNLSSTSKSVIMTLLIIVSLLILGLLFASLFGTDSHLVALADNVVSLIFLGAFIFLYTKAVDKKRYFKNNWWLLVGALPIPDIVTDSDLINIIGAILLIARFGVRVIFLIKVSRFVIPKFYALQVITVIAFFTLLSTELFYLAEHSTNPEVQTHFDSFYWTIVTSTTIGYGDITPITELGRIIAIFMMFIGIGVFGLVSGSAASFLTNRIKGRHEGSTKSD